MQSLLRNAVALDRTHLDRERGRPGDLSAPFERGAEVGRIDDVEAAQVLLALDVRAVRREQCPVLCPDYDRRARREESVRRDSSAGGPHPLIDGVHGTHDLLQVHGRRRRSVSVRLVDAEEALIQRGFPMEASAGSLPLSFYEHSSSISARKAPDRRRKSSSFNLSTSPT